MKNRYLDTPLRRIVALVALLNLGYFGIEFAVALRIGSVSLFADSVDFLEDASVNLLILLAALGCGIVIGFQLSGAAGVVTAMFVFALLLGLTNFGQIGRVGDYGAGLAMA